MNVKKKTINKNLILKIIVLVPFVLITLFCITFSILPAIDRAISIPLVANKVKVEPSLNAIKSYIKDNLKPGMSRDDVAQVLDKLGPYTVHTGEYDKYFGGVVDDIVIKIGIHPLNWFSIRARYDNFSKPSLRSIEFYESPLL